MRALAEDVRREATAIPAEGLSVEDRITRDMLTVLGDLAVAEDDLGMHRLRGVDQIGGPQTLPPTLTTFQPADTPARLDAFLARLRAYGPYIDAYGDIVREGLATGVTAPRIVTERTIDQLRRLLDVPLEQAVVPRMARVANEGDRDAIRDVVRDVVQPAQRRYLELLEGDYLAQSRVDPGLWSAPGGDALYRQAIRSWTTLDLEPADVHQIGLDELDTIDVERRALSARHGHGDDLAAYRAALGADEANVPVSAESLIARATEDIGRAGALAPRYFGRTPRAACEVRPVEEYKETDMPFAYYNPPRPTARGPASTTSTPTTCRRGRTQARDHDLPRSDPGAPLPDRAGDGAPSLNVFRRLGSRLVGSAYIEGWGLYCERLADEMGLYQDDAERLGMLDTLALRAAAWSSTPACTACAGRASS